MASVKLGFVPQADWQFQQSNGAAYLDVNFELPRFYFQRRLYVHFNGGAGHVVRSLVTFYLRGRIVYQMPISRGTIGSNFAVALPSVTVGANTSPSANTIIAQYGSTLRLVSPWSINVAADQLTVQILSSSVVTSAEQFIGIHSEHRW